MGTCHRVNGKVGAAMDVAWHCLACRAHTRQWAVETPGWNDAVGLALEGASTIEALIQGPMVRADSSERCTVGLPAVHGAVRTGVG
jgi:hypothetical protein